MGGFVKGATIRYFWYLLGLSIAIHEKFISKTFKNL